MSLDFVSNLGYCQYPLPLQHTNPTFSCQHQYFLCLSGFSFIWSPFKLPTWQARSAGELSYAGKQPSISDRQETVCNYPSPLTHWLGELLCMLYTGFPSKIKLVTYSRSWPDSTLFIGHLPFFVSLFHSPGMCLHLQINPCTRVSGFASLES